MKLPLWANYRSTDRWGRVWVYSHKPEIKDYQGRRIWSPQDIKGSRMQLIRCGSVPENWEKTLELVKSSENTL